MPDTVNDAGQCLPGSGDCPPDEDIPVVPPPPSRNCDLSRAREPRAGLETCEAGMRCTFVPAPDGAGRAECSVAQATSEGSPCETDAECGVDLNCLHGSCAPACNTATPCENGRRCHDIQSRAGQQVGVCCSVAEGQECDLVTDCGCPRGSTCSVADASGRTRCRILSGSPVAPYSQCNSDSDCPALHSCLDRICKSRCNNSLADCGFPGSACEPAFQAGSQIPGYFFCARKCDMLSPLEPATGFSACGTGSTCSTFSGGRATDCFVAGAGEQGSACSLQGDCAAGLACVFGTCQRWCDPAALACGAGLSCSNVFPQADRDLGLCCTPPSDRACDWVSDCGCGAGETCSRDGELFCRAVAAEPIRPHDPCSVDADCSVRHECIFGVCAQRCRQASDCTQQGVTCLPFIDRDGEGRCSRTCDALSPQAPATGFQPCPSGLTCFIAGSEDNGGSYCRLPGTVAAGGECTDSDECNIGLRCNQGLCRQLCDLAAAQCPSGTDCQVADPVVPTVAGRNLGVCLPD